MMKYKNKRFLMSLSCLLAAMIGLTVLVKSFVPQFVTSYWSLLILFFTIVSVAIYFVMTKVREKNDHAKFTNSYMGVTLAKFLIYLAVILIYILIFPEDKKAFVFTFLAYYFCFTFFETHILVKNKN